MNIFEIEKEIKGCILSAVNKSDGLSVFDRLCDVFKNHFEKPAHNITEIKKRTAKSKGDIFEVFCMMYLRAKGYEVWHLTQVPDEVLKFLGMQSFDVGIDLIARIKIPNRECVSLFDYFYFPVQVKYRKPTRDAQGRTVHRVGWKDISTFLSLCMRTGPPGNEITKKGWLKYVIITNCDNVCWRGKKTKQDWTIAKKSFEKCNNFFWLRMIGHKPKVTIEEDVPSQKQEVSQKTQGLSQRELRAKWLDTLNSKKDPV
jgi:hypothetical protein